MQTFLLGAPIKFIFKLIDYVLYNSVTTQIQKKKNAQTVSKVIE